MITYKYKLILLYYLINMNKQFNETKYPSIIDNNLKTSLLTKLQSLIHLVDYNYERFNKLTEVYEALIKDSKYYISKHYNGAIFLHILLK